MVVMFYKVTAMTELANPESSSQEEIWDQVPASTYICSSQSRHNFVFCMFLLEDTVFNVYSCPSVCEYPDAYHNPWMPKCFIQNGTVIAQNLHPLIDSISFLDFLYLTQCKCYVNSYYTVISRE